jgi:hypothetical protein
MIENEYEEFFCAKKEKVKKRKRRRKLRKGEIENGEICSVKVEK